MGRSVVSGFMWMGRAKALVLGIAAALVASVLILVVVMRPAEAAFPGSTGDIVFATDRDVAAQFQIYRMGADGYDPEKLSDTAGNNDQPAWSSDGAMIAFTNTQANSEVYVMDRDGDPEVDVTDHPASDGEAAFFPGQRKIAFFSNRSDAQATTDNDIYALTFDNNLNTTEVIQLTKSNSADQSPAVSPSGKKIAFMSNRDNGDNEIWRMRADGTNPVNLTNTTSTVGDFRPSWQPIP